MANDPLASLGTPATPATSAPAVAPTPSDPLASLGVPATAASTQQQDTAQQQPPSLASRALGAGEDVAKGFVKGAGDTVSGVSHLINKIPVVGETLAPAQGTAALDQMDTAANTAQKVGKVGEGIAEFATGDEALEGLAKATKFVQLADKYKDVAKALSIAKDHPWFAKMIAEGSKSAIKGAIVGGAQGAIKGAQEDNTAGGAEAGALGGGIGGGIGGVVEGAAAKTNPIKALEQAVRPTGRLGQDFADKAKLALPRLALEHAKTPITNLDELSDAAHEAASNLWKNEVMKQIEKHADQTISGNPVAAAIRKGVSAGDADLFPESADAAENFAKKFDGDMTVQQASDRMQSLNRKLSKLYKLDPASRYAATANSPTIEAMEDGANELRQQITNKLEFLGEKDPAGLRKTYGALKTVEQAAEKRAIVAGRAAPLNIAQQLATIGGAMHAVGHLMAGDVPGAVAGVVPMVAAKATKVLNSPEHLIGSALEETPGVIRRTAGKVAGPLANVGSQIVQGIESPENEGDDQ